VGQLFTDHTFTVPRYQRDYAWDADQIGDFLQDLQLCVDARRAGSTREHFFGGAVMVRVDVPGSSRQNMEVIDGQQRIASFTMLAAKLKQVVLELAPATDPTATTKAFLEKLASEIDSGFLHRMEKVSATKMVPVGRLELSKPDDVFFQALIRGGTPAPTRESHRLLEKAWKKIDAWLRDLMTAGADDEAKAEILSEVHNVMSYDWSLIRMVATSKLEAIRLFRVLNDRGANLTDGDLIRARLLEELENVAPPHETTKIEETWDKILEEEPGLVEKRLQFVFSSMTGKRASHSNLLDEFMDELFPELKAKPLTVVNASAIVSRVEKIYRDTQTLAQLEGGDWPYATSTLTGWDRSRLGLLIHELKHTNCLPLLLSACLLTEAQFSEVVHLVERFMFRYKIICSAHISPATKVYLDEAVNIRANPSAYKVNDLRTKLDGLIKKSAGDIIFQNDLLKLTYMRKASNKNLKYFLITIESYWRWFDANGQGAPKVVDKMQVFDPSATTLEHVYPANADPKITALEPYTDTLGNITLLGQKDNDAVGNHPFAHKKTIFAASTVAMNKSIAAQAQWDAQAVQVRQARLQAAALKVFSF
jgi:hypothetical protein